jgi:hypothetical protein
MYSQSDYKLNNKTNNKETYKKIAEYTIKLKSNLSEFKVGKINDTYNPQKCLIEKEGNTKNFKLLEKKQINEKQKNTFYTGKIMADQNSKYLIFSAKPDSNILEIFPADNWYMFKKDINYKTMNSEEAEEKIKLRSQIIEHLKNKGNSNVIKNNKKEKKDKKNTDIIISNTQKITKNKKNFEEDSYDDEEELFNSPKKNNNKKNQNDFEEISEKELTDLDLREMPSDIEENFFGKVDKKKVKLFDPNDDLSIGKSDINENEDIDEEDDSLFEDNKNKENSEVEDDDDEDDISEIDRKYSIPNININLNEKNSKLNLFKFI